MMAPRWHKAWRDLGEAPARVALAILAMAAGAFGVSMILTAYAVLSRELAATYAGTLPASAILSTDRLTEADVELVRRVPGIRDAEARSVIFGRIRVGTAFGSPSPEGDEWQPLVLFVVRDFRDLRLDTFAREDGAWPPADDEILVERSSLSVARVRVGDRVTVRVTDRGPQSVRVGGSVHAPGLAPGWMDHVVSGFVTRGSVLRSEGAGESTELRIAVKDDECALAEAPIRAVASRVEASLRSRGHAVTRIDVPAPGRHPHADQMDTFLFLLGAFGALTLALSAVLVANMIHALLTGQLRQVGVMKTLGATSGQIAALYLAQVAALAAVSLAIALPLGLSAGRAYAAWAGGMLNATIASSAVPLRFFAVEIAIGVLVPLLVALGPVHRASRISIPDALQNDAGRRPFGTSALERWLARMRWLPRPVMLSIRTVFHRRGRLVLTIATLAAGGAVFLSARNVSEAWARALAGDARTRRYDLDVRLSSPREIDRLASALAAVPGVSRAQYWPEAGPVLVLPNGSDGPRVSVFGPDPGATFLALPVSSGRWLAPNDAGVVVINQTLAARRPDLRIGGVARLRFSGPGGAVVSWRIVGVVRELAPFPAAYAPPQTVREAARLSAGTARSIRVISTRHEAADLRSLSRDIERALTSAGVGVVGVHSLADSRKAFADHLVIIQAALLLAASLVALVGGLGLTTTLTLNGIERTREFGILSAIGATPGAISRSVVLEGVGMALGSWCAALLAAVPVTLAMNAVTGQIFIKSPLGLSFSGRAAGEWLGLVVLLSALASFYPAWRASRLAVREALTYE